MQIPLNVPLQPKRPPLELCKISLYSTGARGKVFTNHFYKALNHNFGVEMVIRNNTSVVQSVKIGGCIYMMFREILLLNGAQLNKSMPIVHLLKIFMYVKNPSLN